MLHNCFPHNDLMVISNKQNKTEPTKTGVLLSSYVCVCVYVCVSRAVGPIFCTRDGDRSTLVQRSTDFVWRRHVPYFDSAKKRFFIVETESVTKRTAQYLIS